MTSNNLNLLSEKKISNSSMISTSIYGPLNKQRSSVRMNDINSNITKNEFYYSAPKEKIDINKNNELNQLNQIYYNKKIQLNVISNEFQALNDNFQKKYTNFRNVKKKYDMLKQKNQNLKLLIMNIMKSNNNLQNK